MSRSVLLPLILLLGAGLFVTGQEARLEASKPDPNRRGTLKAIAACGVPAANMRIAYEDAFQSDVVTIRDLGGKDEARLRCVKDAVHPVYILWIDADDQREAYDKFADREERRRSRAEAIPWLQARGLLGRVPRYDPGKGLETFAHGVEAACSIPAGDALETQGPSGLTIKPSVFGAAMTAKVRDDFTCLTRVFAASNAGDHDIFLGFIGNEAHDIGNHR